MNFKLSVFKQNKIKKYKTKIINSLPVIKKKNSYIKKLCGKFQ